MSEREDNSYELFETPVEPDAAPVPEVTGDGIVETTASRSVHPPMHREAIRSDGSLGNYLRELRTRRGLSIHDVASETKIKPYYLEALEEENFSDLPQLVYVLAYVKKLCSLYELDSEAAAELTAVLRDQLAYELPEDINKSVVSRESSAENDRKLHRMALLLMVIFVMVVILIAVGGIALWLKLRSPGAPTSDPGRQRGEVLELIEKPKLNTSTLEPR